MGLAERPGRRVRDIESEVKKLQGANNGYLTTLAEPAPVALLDGWARGRSRKISA